MPTLEELENHVWGEPEFNSHLVTTCHRLRKKPVETLTVEDLRILIGQTIGMKYLLARVLTVLEREPFAEGDFYSGDLLCALVRPANWPEIEASSERIEAICRRVLGRLAAVDDDGAEVVPGRLVFPDLAKTISAALEAYLNR